MTRNNLTATVLTMILMCGMAQAATVKFAWDASDTAGTATNPVKYRLVVCKDAAFTQCTATDAGTALLAQADLAAGTYWVYAIAYMNMIDTEPAAGIVESPYELRRDLRDDLRYSAANSKVFGLSLADPSITLHRSHNRPRTSSVL